MQPGDTDNRSEDARGADRRAWPRFSAEQLRDVVARTATGGEIRLVDLSRGGARLETDRRMLPNSSLSLKLVTADATFVISGRVVRSRIVRLAQGGLGYDVAVSFSEPLKEVPSTPEPAAEALPEAPAAVQDPPDAEATAHAPFLDAVQEDDSAGGIDDAELEEWAAAMISVTAMVNRPSDQVLDLFDGNDW